MSDVINYEGGDISALLSDGDIVVTLSGYSCKSFTPCLQTQSLLWREGYGSGLTVRETIKALEQMWEQSVQYFEDKSVVDAVKYDLEVLKALPYQDEPLGCMMEAIPAEDDVKRERDCMISAIMAGKGRTHPISFRRMSLWNPSKTIEEARQDSSLVIETDGGDLDWLRSDLGPRVEVIPCEYIFSGCALTSVAIADAQYGVTPHDPDMLATELRWYAATLPPTNNLVVDLYLDALTLAAFKECSQGLQKGAILRLKCEEAESALPVAQDFGQQTLYSGETEMVINGYTCYGANIGITTQLYLWVNDVPFNTNAATLIDCMMRIEKECIMDGDSEIMFTSDRLYLQSHCAADTPVKPSISVRNIEEEVNMDRIRATEELINDATKDMETIQIIHTTFKVEGIDIATSQKYWLTVTGSEAEIKTLADRLREGNKAEVKIYPSMIGGAPLEYLDIAARLYPYERGSVYSAMSTLHKYATVQLGLLASMEGAYHDFLLLAALNSTSSGITWGLDVRMRPEEEKTLFNRLNNVISRMPGGKGIAGVMSLFDVEKREQKQEPIPSDIDWDSVANSIERMDYMPLQTEEYCVYCMSNAEGWHKVLNKLGVRVVQEIEPSHAVITTDDLVDEICPHYNHPEGRVMVLLDSVDYFRGADSIVYRYVFWKGDIAIDLHGNRKALAYV